LRLKQPLILLVEELLMPCPRAQSGTATAAKTISCATSCAAGCAAAPGDDFLRPDGDAAAVLRRHMEMLTRIRGSRPERKAAA
jgi:hypothetical protein